MHASPHGQDRPLISRLETVVVSLAVLAFPIAGALAKQSMATIYIAVAAILLLSSMTRERAVPWPSPAVAAVFLAFAGWVAVVHFTLAVCQGCGGNAVEKLGMLGLVLWVAASRVPPGDPGACRAIVAAAVIGLVGAAALVLVELSLDSVVYRALGGDDAVPYRYNRGITAIVLLAWPVAMAAAAMGRRWLAVLVVVVSLGAASSGESQSAQLAAIAGIGAFALARIAASPTLYLVLAAFAMAGVAAPWLAPDMLAAGYERALALSPSMADRLEIWDHAAAAFRDGAWWGHGIEAHRTLPFTAADAERYTIMTKSPTHPHNAALQLWVEIGWATPVAIGLACWLAGRGVLTLREDRRPFAIAALAATLCVAAVSYGLWQATWMAIVGLMMLLFRVAASVEGSGLPEDGFRRGMAAGDQREGQR